MDKKSKKKFYCKNQNVKNKRQEDLNGKIKFEIILFDKINISNDFII